MRTGIGGLDLGIAGAPPAPEIGARLPVPGVDVSISGPPVRWRCWNCGSNGEGEMPIEHRAPWTDRSPCRGWRLLWFRFWDRVDRAVRDAFAAFARWPLMRAQARFAREERRERWEREHAPKPILGLSETLKREGF